MQLQCKLYGRALTLSQKRLAAEAAIKGVSPFLPGRRRSPRLGRGLRRRARRKRGTSLQKQPWKNNLSELVLFCWQMGSGLFSL